MPTAHDAADAAKKISQLAELRKLYEGKPGTYVDDAGKKHAGKIVFDEEIACFGFVYTDRKIAPQHVRYDLVEYLAKGERFPQQAPSKRA